MIVRNTITFLLLALAVLASANRLRAQDFSYFKSYGANFGEQGNAVVYMDNHQVATGLQLSDPNGGGMVYPGLLVTDELGEKVFCKKYPTVGHPSSVQRLLVNTEGFLMVGTSGGGAWVMQTDSLGDVLWFQRMSIGSAVHISDIKPIPGGYLMTGIGNYNTGSYPEIILMKMDAQGQLIWSKQVQTDNYHLRDIRLQLQGNDIFLAGTGKLDFNFLDVFVMRLDSLANPLWTRHFDTTYDDDLAEFLQDEAGNLYLIGRNYGITTASDLFVITVDANANVLDQRQFDGNNGDEKVRCATFINDETLAISFDHGGSGDRSPAVVSFRKSDYQINWCKSYAYEPQFTNYVLDIEPVYDGGVMMVGDMHVIGKIRDTHLIRTRPNGDVGCFSSNYQLNEYPAAFADTMIYDSSNDIPTTVTQEPMVAVEAFEVVEFEACSYTPPRADFNFSLNGQTPCEQACYQFTDTSRYGPTQWEWTFEGGTPNTWSGATPPTVCWNERGNYQVTLTVSSNDGSHSNTSTLAVDLACSPTVPNVYSPNQDGINDAFIIHNLPEEFSLTIYNRWGKIVFQTEEATKQWQGDNETTKQPVPEGVYYYDLIDAGTDDHYTGYVQLLR